MASNVIDSQEEGIKTKVEKQSDGSLKVNTKPYVQVPEGFADKLSAFIKKGEFWEQIYVVDGINYMEKNRFNVFKELSKTMNNR